VITGLVVGCLASAAGVAAEPRAMVLVVVGAEGTPEYGRQFREWAGRWETAARRGGSDFAVIGLEPQAPVPDREILRRRLISESQASPETFWLILIGHGTYDGKTARFNLRGPDITPTELAAWLMPIDRPLAIVNCASASGPFINELSGKNRIVIAATRSGHEYNLTRFGDFISAAIADPEADLDKDEQTSLLEAFLRAATGVAEFYQRDSRLATEHALLDDNGDGLGTPADWFQGLRATKSAKDGSSLDGLRASQVQLIRSARETRLDPALRVRRDEIELELSRLRERRTKATEEEYLALLEPLLLELARLYEAVDPQKQGGGALRAH
jgi:hypothetical protein